MGSGGTVVECGSHNELVASRGVYWELFRRQIGNGDEFASKQAEPAEKVAGAASPGAIITTEEPLAAKPCEVSANDVPKVQQEPVKPLVLELGGFTCAPSNQVGAGCTFALGGFQCTPAAGKASRGQVVPQSAMKSSSRAEATCTPICPAMPE